MLVRPDARGRRERRSQGPLDPRREALHVGPLAADVTQRCRANASPASISKRRFTLTLDRKRTRAKLALDYRFAGTSPGGAGSGKHVLTGAGRWITS